MGDSAEREQRSQPFGTITSTSDGTKRDQRMKSYEMGNSTTVVYAPILVWIGSKTLALDEFVRSGQACLIYGHNYTRIEGDNNLEKCKCCGRTHVRQESISKKVGSQKQR